MNPIITIIMTIISRIKNWFKDVLQHEKPVVKMPEDEVKQQKWNPVSIPEHTSSNVYFPSQREAAKRKKRVRKNRVQRKSRQILRQKDKV
jgi:hypothetical protein